MDTSKLRKFAQFARTSLMDQVEAKLEHVLATDSAEFREKEKTIKELQEQIRKTSKEAVIERVAYTWFNRFCALRFMDVNRYSKIGIVSPAEASSQPEILMEAKQGHIDERFMSAEMAQVVFSLLNGSRTSNNPQAEAYRLLLVAACNSNHAAMPYLFERIEDYTELLMPEDLLSANSILAYTRESMTPDACESVEVIGWLYQYYISAKKDSVFEALKKNNKKVVPEDIPAATQLFTPHWIVRYLVENSLGRLWLLNFPSSSLKSKMDYYIEPEEAETDFIKLSSPEEIKICDPACGSGHMLTYAFDLLYAIYAEQGYDAAEIPTLILQKNLYGIEIDTRAGALSAFALSMKARGKSRRFLERNIQPNVCVLENIHFDDQELRQYTQALGSDLFTGALRFTLKQFDEADNFGSLIEPQVVDVVEQLMQLEDKDVGSSLFIQPVHRKVLAALRQADYLSPKYDVVLANPPYMGGGSMNARLAAFAKERYKSSKADLFAMFIERNLKLVRHRGLVGMITMQSWMFLSSFVDMRENILNQKTILSMAHLGARGFDSIGGDVVSTTAFILKNAHQDRYKGQYLRLISGRSESEKELDLKNNIPGVSSNSNLYFTASTTDFKKIPSAPIAYWVSDKLRHVFESGAVLKTIGDTRQGMATSDNNRFLRLWYEVSQSKANRSCATREQAKNANCKWFPYNKGGDFRKWYGNAEYYVNWENDGRELLDHASSLYGSATRTIKSISEYFKPCVSWSKVSSSDLAMRYYPQGFIFDVAGCSIFSESEENLLFLLGYTNTIMVKELLSCISPTLNFEAGHVASLPILDLNRASFTEIASRLIRLAKSDWDAYETSWDFSQLPLLSHVKSGGTLADAYQSLRMYWNDVICEVKQIEEENNRQFINAYELQDELKPDVTLEKITLSCNPRYRYGVDKSEAEIEASLLKDTMQEFIHYSVGCMFGRYSLDKPGLILINPDQSIDVCNALASNPSFEVDTDNVIPILDDNWFNDDIVERFQKFLRVTFGEDRYKENLDYIEGAIGKPLRKYFLKDFYDYHVRRYKKRPIYWMFTSPKGTFSALIYLHRYRPDTVSVILNDYLRNFRTKLEAKKVDCQQIEVSAASSAAVKTKAIKEIAKLTTMIDELNQWEHNVLYPLATKRIEIDLDDGVKVNYLKFGKALKEIKGLANESE